ncbi:MAG: glycosyltransferase [Prevotella shahii]|jgi:glycosyltransferase|uniref:glycosyltransferase family 2 protein n=1 Tax=Hoylesella shahii TaxID=228603 RepID=UPI001CAF8053|nr:glycosyltransferase family 2 protein [Hoylesella shahii]MBF1568023.1 glycosyltransferase [Hoylesella shahii]MBF1575553.1 glycosyltransferase [Hoylesella shahii]
MKVSIITVAFNSAATIAHCMQSVLDQSYSNIEYIVVDGLSKDNTLNIVREFEPLFAGKMRWISENDNGIYDAMNKGLHMATGDVVGILNSDDFFTDNDVIEKVAQAFTDDKIDAVYGDVHFVRETNLSRCVRYYSSAGFRPWWLRFGIMPAHPSFYARKEVFQKAGLYKTDYKIGGDFEMMVRLFKRFDIKTKYLPMVFVTMRMGGASTKNVGSRLTLLREDTRACRENGVYTHPLLICLKYFYKVLEFRF